MASDVDICNLALAHLGDEANVSSINPPEGSAQAEHCKRFYPIARNALLEAHGWGFATRRKSLAELDVEDTDDELTQWGYAYAYPSDCVRPLVLLMPGATDDNDAQDFVVETLEDGTRVIYTNVEDAKLKYVRLVTDTTKYTPLFVSALARLLASYLAGPIVKGETGMKVAQAHYSSFVNAELPLARGADANARRDNPYQDFTPSGISARA